MMDFEEGGPSSYCSRAGQKRSHSQISTSSHNTSTNALEADSRSSSSAWRRPSNLLPRFTSTLSSIPLSVPATSTDAEDTRPAQRLQLPPPNLHHRFAGDGYDFRRPISSSGAPIVRTQSPHTSQQGTATGGDAIDLTGSDAEEDYSSGPSQSDSQGSMSAQRAAVGQARSAITDYLTQRREVAHNAVRERQRPSRLPRFGREVLNQDVEVIELGSDDEGTTPYLQSGENSQRQQASPEVEFLSSRPLSPARRRPQTARGHRPASARPIAPGFDLFEGEGLEDFMEEIQVIRENRIRPTPRRENTDLFQRFLEGVAGRPVGARLAARLPFTAPAFLLPGDLDFGTAAFNFGYDSPEPEPATYEAPPPPPTGFTRSPQEDETVICPNCDRELCSGETDLDKQVWVLKTCGHVYCGTCAANRSISATKRRERNISAKSAVFKQCKVEGCGKRCSGQKSMFQLFL